MGNARRQNSSASDPHERGFQSDKQYPFILYRTGSPTIFGIAMNIGFGSNDIVGGKNTDSGIHLEIHFVCHLWCLMLIRRVRFTLLFPSKQVQRANIRMSGKTDFPPLFFNT